MSPETGDGVRAAERTTKSTEPCEQVDFEGKKHEKKMKMKKIL
jgi:hypothetical protein